MFPSRLSRHRARFRAKARSGAVRRACVLGISSALLVFPVAYDPVFAASSDLPHAEPTEAPKANCELNSARGDIKHVIYIQFGHLRYLQDNANVPSDLEQMPHLLKFMESNGVLLTNHHTVLSTATAANALSAMTGLYPDRLPSRSGYWTAADPMPFANSAPNQSTAAIAAATPPWLVFTRAGCNVGAVGIASMALENGTSDVLKTFGPNSLEAALFADPSTSPRAAADLLGIAIHCAPANPVCALGIADEPGRDQGFSALFGHKNIAPILSPGAPLYDLSGNIISDGRGNVGFPGAAKLSAAQSLAYVAAMQEHSVPVTYAYISPAHGNHSGRGAFGPGEAAYVGQLKAYDDAFDKFLTRLAAAGLTQNNTLFVITSDESDHFIGGPPSPATCDGPEVPCVYTTMGTPATNLKDLLARQNTKLGTVPFENSTGMAAAISLRGNPSPGDDTLRQFEKAMARLKAINPSTGSPEQLAMFLAESPELNLLHMTSDASHSPNFVLFGYPDHYFQASGSAQSQNESAIVWNHGGVSAEQNTTFLGLVGPGINVKGIDRRIWSDHTDARPTMLALLGLRDDYETDGRVLTELFHEWAFPKSIRENALEFLQVAEAYKKINAPVAELGLTSLRVSTAALADDVKYDSLERQLAVIVVLRNDLASAMASVLHGAAFHGRRISPDEARQLVRSADDLTEYVKLLAANGW